MERQKAERARRETDCRLDFLTNPDHEEDCVCDPPCSREYNPWPYRNADPWPAGLYEGSCIPAIYATRVDKIPPQIVLELAGWNITTAIEEEPS